MRHLRFTTLPAATLAFALSLTLFSQTVAAPAVSTSTVVEYVA